MSKIEIAIGNNVFRGELYDNKAVRDFTDMLPFTAKMEELNRNEKYCYLPKCLPTESKKPGTIYAGDIMLFGSDCLVLFYKNFLTSYAYTALGHIENADGLEEAVGKGNVTVKFQKMEV